MICPMCDTQVTNQRTMIIHFKESHDISEEGARKYLGMTVPEAIRVSHPLRYDILDPIFLEMLAKIADYGSKKYGDFNWHNSRLTGDKSPINHIYKHLKSYRMGELYDHPELGYNKSWHLAAIAFNAMMEAYYCMREEEKNATQEGIGKCNPRDNDRIQEGMSMRPMSEKPNRSL